MQSVAAVALVAGAILISTFVYIFQLPSEWKANWIFRMAESSSRSQLLDSTEHLLLVCAVAPVLWLNFIVALVTVGWIAGIAYTLIAVSLLLVYVELQLDGWRKIPFTCSHVPGRRNFWQLAGFYSALFGVVIPTITFFEVHSFRVVLVLACCGLLILYRKMRTARRAQLGLLPILFDESEEPAVRPVQLNLD